MHRPAPAAGQFAIEQLREARNKRSADPRQNKVILKAIRNVLPAPTSHIIDKAVTLEHRDTHALPPRKKYYTLDAQKFPHGFPISGISKVFRSGVIEFDEAVESPHLTCIDEEGDVRVTEVRLEGPFSVETDGFETGRE